MNRRRLRAQVVRVWDCPLSRQRLGTVLNSQMLPSATALAMCNSFPSILRVEEPLCLCCRYCRWRL